MNDLAFTIVTCCNRMPTEDYYILGQFIKSLERWDSINKLLVLSEQNMGTRWDGLGTKPKWVFKAIKDNIIDTRYIVFCDCWDLVFTHSPERLLKKSIYHYNAPLVISSEKNCFPTDLKEQYDSLNPPTSYKYLNSGMIVGEVDALLSVLESMDLKNVPDDYRNEDGSMTHINDQFLFMQEFIKQPVEMKLDYYQIVCQTMHDVSIDELDLTGDWIRNKETKRYPCSIHMNGGSKTSGVKEPILQKLGL